MSRKVISRFIFSASVVASSYDLKCCRRSELPIYSKEDEKCPCPSPTKETMKSVMEKIKPVESDCNVLEQSIRRVRKSFESVMCEVKGYEQIGLKYVSDGIGQAQWLLNYLGQEDNIAPKGPAIAIGGLAGFIFALRGGFFRKLLFTTAGAVGMASVCYPKEAAQYGRLALTESKQYATILYNFIYGVKKGDPPLELPSLPKLPENFSEAISLATNWGKTSVSDQESELVCIPIPEIYTPQYEIPPPIEEEHEEQCGPPPVVPPNPFCFPCPEPAGLISQSLVCSTVRGMVHNLKI